MAITKIQKTAGPPAPNIHLGASCPDMVSVCLTAPDRAGTLAEQTLQILDIIDGHLMDAGSSRQRLLMVQVWLADMAGFAEFRDVWNAWIDADNVPALSVVEAQAARRDSLIEIRAYAAPGRDG
jgi:enamine deaminase RidA (YjgF/YER057c/UK114 family)